jgi:hypothetical protein
MHVLRVGSGFPWEKRKVGVMLSPKEPSLTTIFGGRGAEGRGGAYVSEGGFKVNILTLTIYFHQQQICVKCFRSCIMDEKMEI